ncbi:MAG: hypothetical protein WCK09_22020 [Bacteroidota bacterium]
MKIKLLNFWVGLLLILFFLTNQIGYSQNGKIGDGFGTNNWSTIDAFTTSAGTSRIQTFTANATGNRYFRLVTNWSGNNDQWGPSSTSVDYQVTPGVEVPSTEVIQNSTSKAYYINVGSVSNNYVFKTKEGNNPPNNRGLIVFEVQGSIRSVSGVSKDLNTVYRGQTVTITATLDGSFSAGQRVYLRYTNDGFTSSTVVEMSGSGTSYTATIPAGTNTANATVNYYVFTSGNGLTISAANADWYTINLNNNSGSNYSYVVSASYITKTDGNWSSTSTWDIGQVPPNGEAVIINNNVTLDQNATVSSLTINSGKTFTASDATPRTLTISTGGTVPNSGTFTHGSGTVAFAGTGTVTGTVGFNNVTLAGGVNFGSGSTINGTLTINAGGFVSINAPVYAAGSTLLYNTGGSYGRGAEWSTTSGAGYPANVQIGNNTTLNVNNNANAARQIAGNLTVDNGSTFSMEGMTIVDPTVIGVTISGNIINYGTITLATSTERLKTTNFTNHNITTLSTNSGGVAILF